MPRSTRKKQSRLSFTPLPSSSPATKGYNKQIQDRAAAVTLQGSSKKRKQDAGDEQGDLDNGIPTPAGTVDRGIPSNSSDDDLVAAPSQECRRKARQQRIDFSNSRDAESFDLPVKLRSPARAQSSSAPGIFGGSQKRRATVISSDDESEAELPSPAKIMDGSKSRKREQTTRRGGGGRLMRRGRRSSPIESNSEESNTKNTPRQLPLPVELDDEDDEDEMPSTMATQRRRGRPKRQATPDSFISSSPPPAPIDSDDDLEIVEQPSKRPRDRRDETSEDEDGEPTPSRRRLQRQRKFTKQEEEDLADDLDFLGPSSDVEESSRRPRDTLTTQKAARQTALEKLKRQRSSQPAQSQPISIEDDPDAADQLGKSIHRAYDILAKIPLSLSLARDTADFESISIDTDDEEDDGDEVEEAQAPMTSRQYFTANKDDDDFIEQEEDAEDGVLGVPDANMSIGFTHYARMKPKELFPYAVEWMIQKKINPGFAMNDELYALTFRKLDDEVKGLAGSKFTSSAWTEEFTYALRARPEIAYDTLDRNGEHYMADHCGACNRSGHPATFRVQFQGKPYHNETLEDVNNDEDDNSDSDSDSDSDSQSDDNTSNKKTSWDAEGRQIVPESKIYFVGKFCMGNAQTAHALQHWKHHLNDWVVTWMTKNGYLDPAEIVKRDGWNENKRRKAANRISDRMEKEGVTARLWRDFRDNIDEARDSKQGRF